MKIMFHVLPTRTSLGGGRLGIFPSLRAHIERESWCFSIWAGGGMTRNISTSENLYGGEAENFSNFLKAYLWGWRTSTTMSLRVECSRLVFGEVVTAFPRHTAVSFQREFGAYMEETKEWHLAPCFARCFVNILCSKEEEARYFSKSQGLCREGRSDFSRSQSLGGSSEFFQVPEHR